MFGVDGPSPSLPLEESAGEALRFPLLLPRTLLMTPPRAPELPPPPPPLPLPLPDPPEELLPVLIEEKTLETIDDANGFDAGAAVWLFESVPDLFKGADSARDDDNDDDNDAVALPSGVDGGLLILD